MPRKPVPGDRERIEAALSPSMLDALAELMDLLRWGGNWRGCDSAKQLFETAAVVELASTIRRESGCGYDISIARACGRLGLKYHTIDTRYRRWYAKTRSE